jgi:pimeloyl-ACP methyl ester carboxylesterase
MITFENDRGSILYNKSELHFLKFGTGSRVLLAFHGFGLDKESFLSVEEKLGTDYTIYSFDLFFHGQSYWAHKDIPLEKKDFREMIQSFLAHFEIHQFSLITYSLGGKFGLCVAEAFPSKLDRLIMVASDGFVISPWYKFATGYTLTRQVLKFLVFSPKLYFELTHLFNKLHLIPHATIRFAELNMSTRGLRRKVYLSWVVFRRLQVDTDILCESLNKHGVVVELYFGDKDLLIPMKAILRRSGTIVQRKVAVFNCSHSKVLLEYAKSNDIQ